jgi:hypothetical protein
MGHREELILLALVAAALVPVDLNDRVATLYRDDGIHSRDLFRRSKIMVRIPTLG